VSAAQSNRRGPAEANRPRAGARGVDSGVASDDETYGPERAERLVALLRALAARIVELDRAGRLLEASAELQQILGSARSELFHYEVRSTYDTPEVAESRRIVEDAERRMRDIAFDEPGDGDDEPWRRSTDG